MALDKWCGSWNKINCIIHPQSLVSKNSSFYFKLFLRLLCLLACIYQMIFISLSYFAYETVSRVHESLVTHAPAPNLSLCIDYNELMQLNPINRKQKSKEPRPSVKDIFDSTPKLTDQIVSCKFHKPNAYFMVTYNSSNCLQYFLVDKFLLNQFVCYRITLDSSINHELYDYRIVSESPTDRGNIYTIQFWNKMFLFNSHLIVSFFGPFPLYSIKLTSQLKRELDLKSKVSSYNSYYASFKLYTIHLLPKPYDTMCTQVNAVTKMACYELCMEKELQFLQRVPFMVLKTKPTNLMHFNRDDLRNTFLESKLNEANKLCSPKCTAFHECRINFCTTKILQEKGSTDKLTVSASVPTEPSVFTVSSPRITLMEYIIYLSSALSLWFGFHVTLFISKRSHNKFKFGSKQKVFDFKMPLRQQK